MKTREMMSKEVITVLPDTPVHDVAALLVKNKISGVPVVDETGRILGIISEEDLLRKRIAPKAPDVMSVLGSMVVYDGMKEYQEAFRKMAASTAKEIMSTPPFTADVNDDLDKIGEMILNQHIRRIPILEKGKLVGIISRSDLIKLLL